MCSQAVRHVRGLSVQSIVRSIVMTIAIQLRVDDGRLTDRLRGWLFSLNVDWAGRYVSIKLDSECRIHHDLWLTLGGTGTLKTRRATRQSAGLR